MTANQVVQRLFWCAVAAKEFVRDGGVPAVLFVQDECLADASWVYPAFVHGHPFRGV